MAALSGVVKIFNRVLRDAADVTSINSTIDTYITNGVDGVADGSNVSIDNATNPNTSGQSEMFTVVGIGGYKAGASPLSNKAKTFAKVFNGSTTVAALQAEIDAWLVSGVAKGARIDCSISFEEYKQGAVVMIVNVAIGAADVDAGDIVKFYVEEWGDDTSGDGSASNPFATISAAVAAIVARGDNALDRPYAIKVGPGEFDDNVVLNGTSLYNITIEGSGTAATILNATAGNAIESSADNDQLELLRIKDIRIQDPVVLAGESNATDFGTGLVFKNVYFDTGATCTVRNCNSLVATDNTAFVANLTITDVAASYFGAGVSLASSLVTINGDNAALLLPAAWSGTTVCFFGDGINARNNTWAITPATDDVSLFFSGGIVVGGALTVQAGSVMTCEGSCHFSNNIVVEGDLDAYSTVFEGNLTFGGGGIQRELYDSLVQGDLTIDAASGPINLYNSYYIGILTDPAPVLAHTRPYPQYMYEADVKRGTVTIDGANTTAAVAFAAAFPDANYYIALGMGTISGGAVDPEKCFWTSKLAGGFDVNVSAAPTAGESVVIDWIAVHA